MIESIPLIQNANDAQQINASIIAMKKASKALDDKIAKLNILNSELDKKIAILDNGLAQEITDRQSADSTEVTNRNTAITNAVNALDVASVGGSGKYISAISETNGKISATASDLGNMVPVDSVTSGNMHSVTSNAVHEAIRLFKSFYNYRFQSGYNFFELGRLAISSGAVSGFSFLIGLYQDRSSIGLYPLNFGCINVSSGSSADSFNINGFFSIPFPSTFAIAVYKTSTQYILYLYSGYIYASFTASLIHSLGTATTSYSYKSTFEGTQIYNSAVDTSQIKFISQLN